MKKVFSSIILFLISILIITNIYANSSINANLVTLVTPIYEIQEGQVLTISLELNNHDEKDEGLYSYKATLEYDEDIFEEVEQGDFIGINDWEEIYYNKTTKEFISIKKAGSKQNEEVIRVNLKVKNDANPGVTTVKVKDIVCSDGKKDIEVNPVSKDVEIVKSADNTDNKNDTNSADNSNSPDNKNDVNNADNSNSSDNKNDANDADNSNSSDNKNDANNADNSNSSDNKNDANDADNSNSSDNKNDANDADNSNSSDNKNDTNSADNSNGSYNKNDENNTDNKNSDKVISPDDSNNQGNSNSGKGSSSGGSKSSGSSNGSSNSSKIISTSDSTAAKDYADIYNGKIPNTGRNYTILFCLIGVEVVFATVSLIKYNKMTRGKETVVAKRKIKGFATVFCTTIIFVQLFGASYTALSAFATKGELTGNDIVDYSDANLLEKHLIHLEALPDDKLENADMNSDGKLTVTDLSILVKKIENLLEYEVELSDISVNNYYPNKNDEITLSFSADINYESNIKAITINNEEYTVSKLDDKYEVKLNSGDKSGIQEFKITKVLLNTGKEVDIDYAFEISVLKQEPVIEDYTLDDKEEGKAYISFNLKDEDDSVTSAKVTVSVKTENDSEDIVKTQDITKGNNKVEISTQSGKTYQVKIVANYDLAQDQLADHKEEHKDVIEIVKEFEADLDYKFEMSNIVALKDGETKSNFDKNETIEVGFESTNASDYEPSNVKINGKTYTVSKEKDTGRYVATIDGFTIPGENEIVLESIILSNGKEFELEENNTIKVTINKAVPAITEFNSEEDIDNKNIKVTFNVEDEDNTIKTAKVEIYDAEGNVIESKDIDLEDIKKGKVEVTLNTTNAENTVKTDKYTVKVIANYNIGDSEETEKEVAIYEKDIEAKVYAKIESATLNNSCVEKGEDVTITYKIDTNSKSEISKICINGTNYGATKLDNGEYQVTLKASEKAGVQSLDTTKVIFKNSSDKENNTSEGEGKSADVQNTLKVDVLKDAPVMGEMTQKDNLTTDTIKILFHVTDPDNAFVSGNVQLIKKTSTEAEESKNSDEEVIVENDFEPDENGDVEIGFSGFEEKEEYIARFIITYNRHNSQDENNEDKYETISNDKKIDLTKDYNFKVTNIVTLKDGEPESNFDKNETIKVGFESSNSSSFEPSSVKINGKTYTVSKEEDTGRYVATVDGFTTPGENTITLESVVLSNDREFEVQENNTVKVIINKTVPTVTEFNSEEDIDNKNIKVTFNVEDEDNTIKTAKVEIYDAEGNVIESKDIALEDIKKSKVEVTLNTTNAENTVKTDKYTVKVIANYNIGDSEETEKEVAIYEKDIEAKVYAKIESATLNSSCVEKGEDVTITYKIDTNSKLDVSKICINGTNYSATKLDNGEYQVTLKATANAGEQEFSTTKVIFKNSSDKENNTSEGEEKSADVQNTLKVDVLKTAPSIENIEQVDKTASISFHITDADNAYVSGKVELYKIISTENSVAEATSEDEKSESSADKNVKEEKIQEVNIEKDKDGNGTVSFTNLSEDEEYIARFVITYNRHNKDDEKIEEKYEIISSDKKFDLNPEYNLKVTNMVALKDGKTASIFDKDETIKIGFESTNSSSFEPSSVKINGKIYEVSKEDNRYVATIDGFTTAGENEVVLESITLSNGKEFKLEENNTVKITINKTAPTVTGFDSEEDVTSKKLKVTFNIVDADKTIKSAKVEIYDAESSTLISSEDLTESEIESGKIVKTLSTTNAENTVKTDKYTVKVLAKYELVDSSEDTSKLEYATIHKEVIDAEIYTIIKSSSINKEYAERENTITISYLVDTNVKSEISKICVNDTYYEVTKKENGYYEISLNIPEDAMAGKQEFNATKIKFDDEDESEVYVSNKAEIEILKAIPQINTISKNDDFANNSFTVEFTMLDPDNAYKSGNVQLVKISEGENSKQVEDVLQTVNISENNKNKETGNYEISFSNLSEDEKYIIRYVITYNRYTENSETKDDTVKVDEDINLVREYNLKVSNIKTFDLEKEKSIFSKNEAIIIKFESTNSSSFVPSSVKVNGKAYTVSKEDFGKYVATIDGFSKAGENKISIDSIKLSNGKELELKENNSVTVTINKTKPSATDFDSKENVTDKNIKVSFNLVDEESTVQSIDIELYNVAGDLIDSKTITDISDTGKIESTLSTANAGKTDKYTVKVIANYKLIESAESVERDTILSKDIEAKVYANIESATLNSLCVEKGGDVTITYKIDTNSKLDVSKICVNDSNYNAEKLETGDYKVTLKAADDAGEQEFITTKVIFKNSSDEENNTSVGEEKSADVQNTLKVDVLKSAASVENIRQIEDLENHSMEVTFHIADEDKSYISGKIQLIKVTSGSEESLGETDIKINKNGDGTVNFNGLEVKQEYIARFVITYNRHNKDDEKIEEKYETSNVDEEIELIGDGDYNLKISELTTLSEGKETSIFNKNQEITLSFASENSSVFVPDSIKVDGKAYSVEKGESTNKYIAKIDGFTTAGEKTISVESMTLSNGKELELEENNTVKVTINKTVPTAKDFVAEENLTDKNIKVSFNLVDEENTVQSIAIELYNAAGSVIDSKNIAVSDISDTGKIELTLSTANAEKTDKYTVKVIANYKLIESAENTESSTILSQDVDAIVYANIESASISNSCVEKGEDVIIIYKIDTNSKSDVSKICINGLNYAAEKLETGDYKVTLKAADGAGEQEFNATKVIFENSDDNNTEDKVVDASKELKVKADVLKSVPQIDGEIEQIDDVKNHSIKLKFTLEDIDDAYVSGKVELRKVTAAENNKGNANAEGDAVTENSATENNEVVTESIISKSEDNECTVELTGLESDTKYTAKFLITYNRHNIKTEMSNENKNEILPVEDKEIELIVNCNLTINDIEALKDGEYTTVFEKNDEIKLAFYSTNTSGFEPESAVINDEEYTLSKENDKYIALLDGYAKAGSKIITIQSITLENGREISVDKNNTITIIVNNTVPTVENFTSEENEEDKTVRVSFNIADEDNTIQTAIVGVFDVENNLIDSKEITAEDIKNGTIEKTLKFANEDESTSSNNGNEAGSDTENTDSNDESTEKTDELTGTTNPSDTGNSNDGAENSRNDREEIDETPEIVEEPEAGNYTVKVIATYQMTELLENRIIFEKEITNEVYATIEKAELNKDCVEKGENATITYTIDTNSQSKISKMRINNVEYDVTKTEDGKYQVTFRAPNTVGEQEISATSVIFEDGESNEAEVENTIKLEVLKAKPQINLIRQEEDHTINSVTIKFSITDADKAINKNSVKVQLIKPAVAGNTTNTDSKDSAVSNTENIADSNVENNTITIGQDSVENDVKENTVADKTDTLEANTEVPEDKVLQEYNIVPGEDGNYTVTFNNLEEDEIYKAKFIVNCNRHTVSKENADETITEEKDIEFVDDYKLKLSDIKTYNSKEETQYFERNETVKLEFVSTNSSEFIPEAVVINGKEYPTTKVIDENDNSATNASQDNNAESGSNNTESTENNKYQVELTGFDTTGEKDLEIKTVILSNKEYLNISTNNKTKIEVLKEAPIVKGFSYQPTDNQITAKFTVVDEDESITSIVAVVTANDANNTVIKNETLTAESTEVTFDKNGANTYTIKIIANYDLDTNAIEIGKNEYQNQILLEQQMDNELRMVEMKDITDVTLYKIENDTVSEITSIKQSEINTEEKLQSYVVKVEMKDMPAFYSTIKEANFDVTSYNEDTGAKKGNLNFVLDYDNNVVQYDNNNEPQSKVTVTFAPFSGAKTLEANKDTSFESIIDKMNTSSSANITLTSDVDASGCTAISGFCPALVDGTYTGTFDGNGHTIYNLSSTIFNNLSGATIKNLIIENAIVEAKQNTSGSYILTTGVIANGATNSTFTNVHIKNSRLTTSWVSEDDGYGMLAGHMSSGNISNCSVTNMTIKGDGLYAGGLVGNLKGGNITNNYVTGSIEYNESYGAQTQYNGGLVGSASSSANISYNIAKVEMISVKGPDGNGGLVGSASGAILTGNVSLSTGNNAYKLVGNSASSGSSNNYELAESTLPTASYNYVQTISKNDITEDFFANRVKLNTNIWNLKDASYDNLPTLKNLDPNNANKEYGANSNLYIPDSDRLSSLSEFDENRKIAYSNMYKLMPFYDAKYLVEDGNTIKTDDILNTKFIKSVLAYDINHDLIVDITKENCEDIDTIKVIFTDDTVQDYEVKFKNNYANIASYKIEGLDIDYNYSKFILKEDAEIVDELVNYIKNINYSKDLSGIMKVSYGGRIYREHFEETVKPNAKEFILKYLDNSKIGAVVSDNTNISAVIRNKLITNGSLKEILFGYNYYSRWYDIDIDGAEISDIMLFKNDVYGKSMGIDNLMSELLNSKWVNSPQNKYFYRDNIAPRTGYANVGDFIDYNVTTLGHYTNTDDWFTDSFKGFLYEAPAKNHPELDYRAWTQLKKNDTYLLALLTIPENSGYMVSYPTQFLVGSVSIYGLDVNTESGRNELLAKMKSFGDNFATFYNTTAGFVDSKYLNDVCDIEIDRTGGGVEINEKTTDPFIKNFNEALYEWREITMGGQGAYGQDGKIVWVVFSALNDFNDATHETGHVQASKIFMENKGRRGGTTTTIDEDYPDGNIRQSFGDGSTNFNLTFTFGTDSNITTNLTPERIDTREKIESYYKEMFYAIDFLDYAEAKAFLQLTPEEQSKVAVQVYYPRTEVEGYDSSKAKASDYIIVGWRTLTKEQFEAMNLKTIEDIYDNHITIKPGVNGNSTLSGETGSYGYEGLYVRHWYQPHNDYSRTYSYGLKATAWEMLGVGGYEGYVTYYSGASANDLDAIRKVTGDSTMTWRKYKLGRYELMENKWNSMSYIDTDELVSEYVTALKTDAANGNRSVSASTDIRRSNYQYLKRVTDDFRSDIFTSENETHITSAEEFVQKISADKMGCFVLDNDIDLSTLTGITGKSIISGTFSGYLNGNGHKLIGNTLPIFNNIKYANISNIVVEGSRITLTTNSVGSFANSITYSRLNTISGNDIEISSTGNKIGGLIGEISNKVTLDNVTATNVTVSGNKEVGGIIAYANNCAIENVTGNSITVKVNGRDGNNIGGIIGTMSGTTLNNVNTANITVTATKDVGGITGSVTKSTVTAIKGNKINVTITGQEAGGFIGIMTESTLTDMNITEANVSGISRIGGIVGYIGKTTIENSSSDATVIATGNAVGGFAGEIINSSAIKNCYAIGTLEGNQDIGGFVGYTNNSTVTNCYAYVRVTGKVLDKSGTAIGSAGFIGQAVGGSIITNNISLSNQSTAYKFDGRTSAEQFAGFSNNYEYAENTGNSTLNRTGIDFTGKISTVTKDNYITTEFFTDTLNWDTNIWDLSCVADEKLPRFKNSDLDKSIFKTYTIASVDEFIDKINADPEGIYSINSDLDFSGKTYELGSSVIETAFIGKIEGNNHTISNLTNTSLFNEFKGKVYNLNISNVRNNVQKSISTYDNVTEYIDRVKSYNDVTNYGVFAKTTASATLSNIKIDSAVIFAKEYVGLVTSKDTNSTFDRISVSNSFVEARSPSSSGGTCTSLFIGKANGSKITNCYVQGELRYFDANKVGAVIGEATNVTVDKVISDVVVIDYQKEIASGFIGAFTNDNSSKVTNSVVHGPVSGYGGQRKFVATSGNEANINQLILRVFENCYESKDSKGNNNSNATTAEKIKIATDDQFISKDFYVNTLGFDENIWNLDDLKIVVYKRYKIHFYFDDTSNIINIGLK